MGSEMCIRDRTCGKFVESSIELSLRETFEISSTVLSVEAIDGGGRLFFCPSVSAGAMSRSQVF